MSALRRAVSVRYPHHGQMDAVGDTDLFLRVLVLILGGYLFLDKAFAWLHVPGIPVFPGEVLMALAIWQLARLGMPLRRIQLSGFLVAFVGLALLRLLWDFDRLSLVAIRDFAPWYYSIIALAVAATLIRGRGAWDYLVAWYRRAAPWILVWSPVAIVANRLFAESAPNIPDSATSILSFKPGDITVHAALAMAFLWIDDKTPLPRKRFWTAAGVLAITVAATQSRGGLLAAAVVLSVVLFYRPVSRRDVGKDVLVGLAVVVTLGLVSGFAIDSPGGREISAEQFLQNIATPSVGVDQEDALAGTVEWRIQLWGETISDLKDRDALLFGRGFGPALFLFADSNQPGDALDSNLRNPHNSHLNILARTGVVGLAMWLMLLGAWASGVGKAIGRRARPAAEDTMLILALAGVAGWLVTAIFDPALEGPQGSIWLWALVGVGMAGLTRKRISAA